MSNSRIPFVTGRRRVLLAAILVSLGKIFPVRAATPVLDDFGGVPGLTAMMEDFDANLMADDRTRPFFENVDRKRVKAKLVEQFCALLGGDCVYRGGNMKGIHRGLGITREDFNALIEALQDAMDKHDVPFRSQNKLLALLAPMHRDIVEK
ncbi:MAG: group 1 truncated hemoglobin [Rhodospirillaceae bacterium]|nr:group 1 truncated hemoglobin [Rhodospirillaceae bacterium]